MKKIILPLAALLLAVSLASAADNHRIVTLQILKSAAQPVSFANRSPAIYGMLYMLETNGTEPAFINDSSLVHAAAVALKETLEEYDALADYDVPVYDYFQPCAHRTACDSTVEDITDNDLLIVVKGIDLTAYQQTESKYSDNYGSYYQVSVYVPYTATFEVLDVNTGTRSHQTTLSDTLVWRRNASNPQAVEGLPTLKDATIMAAAEIGKLYAQQLVPYWISVQRFIFVPSGRDLRKAADYAENAQWDEAMKIWERYAGGTDRKVAAQAAFNMALACEINSNYELALEWLQYAEKLYPVNEIQGYRQLLQRRISDSSILEKQLEDL
jgi:tetratricopeptide (TPR) repeat protein